MLIHIYNIYINIYIYIFLFTNILRGFKDKQGKYNDITEYAT